MKSILFLSLSFIAWAAMIASLIVKARDIARNTKTYDIIPGYEKYRTSFWYERKYNRYGRHYQASVITGVISLVLGVPVYMLLGTLIQKHFLLPPDAFFLESGQLYLGSIACIFFQIVFAYWVCFHSQAPICIASTLYAFNSARRSDSWAKLTVAMLIVCVLCLPIMALSVHAYSYADEEKIVTHDFLSFGETEIPYDTILSAETSYTSNGTHTEFTFSYHILLQDGSQVDIMEFGTEGADYLHALLQKQGVPIEYGEIDAATYEQMKLACKDSTIELAEQCFVILP